MALTVAIIGAGPSGFYAAAALIKLGLDVQIDILERLPTPFGLIRAGVAPDHQSTKNVIRSFTRTALEPPVHYYGNVTVGRDLSLAELRGIYDAVVVASGAPSDRPLGVPGSDKAGCYGAAEFVGWYNGHPDLRGLNPDLDTSAVCVVGVGNVAIDVARVLVKTPAEMAGSDLTDYAAEAIHKAPITDVYIIGRRGPVQAKFTHKELREMGGLEDCTALADPAQMPETIEEELSERDRRLREKNLATLKSYAENTPDPGKRKRVHFVFFAAPKEVLGGERVEGLRLERTRLEGGRAVGSGETFDIACGAVVAAIGYRFDLIEGLPPDERTGVVANREGRVDGGLYVVGWAKRGPTGVIGTNKHDGDRAAEQIQEDIGDGDKPGRPALEALLGERGVRWVSFEDWQRIDSAEVAAAPPGAPRRKFVRVAEMLDLLDE
ncbi:MAG: FAD-dependent oxidoreductase [Kiloniellales bacterium]